MPWGGKPTASLKKHSAPRIVSRMAVTLSQTACAYAEGLITRGKAVHDERDDWSEHQPSAKDENEFIDAHGWAEYGRWHLGVDGDEPEDTKKRYSFPYGDFTRIHRCGVISAESRAGQYKYDDIRNAAKHLLDMMDAQK
jgi:hypothetical protein